MSVPVSVALIGATMSAGLAIIYGGSQLQAQLALQGVADNAALAAADAKTGLIAAEPCQLAQTVARSANSELQWCDSGEAATVVEVTRWVFGRKLEAKARAG